MVVVVGGYTSFGVRIFVFIMSTQEMINDPKLARLFELRQVTKAYLFGSTAKGSASSTSDVDLLVEFNDSLSPIEIGEMWWALYDDLRVFFGKPVDLLMQRSLKNPYFRKEVERTRKLIYG